MKRKNRVRIVLAIFISALAGAASTSAQPCPAPPDCPNDPFIRQTPIVVPISLPNGDICWLTVEYCARLACGLWRDIYITRFYYDEKCVDLSAKEMIDAAMDGVIGANPNPWGINIPFCPSWMSSWRIFTAGCYTTEIAHGITYIDPCLQPAMCWAEYRFCREASTGTITHQLIYQGAVAPCPNAGISPKVGGCISFCPS